jgi:hypothetical protein
VVVRTSVAYYFSLDLIFMFLQSILGNYYYFILKFIYLFPNENLIIPDNIYGCYVLRGHLGDPGSLFIE